MTTPIEKVLEAADELLEEMTSLYIFPSTEKQNDVKAKKAKLERVVATYRTQPDPQAEAVRKAVEALEKFEFDIPVNWGDHVHDGEIRFTLQEETVEGLQIALAALKKES